MADTFTVAKRRLIMQSVRRSRTHPEIMFGNALQRSRIAFKMNCEALPGRPDFLIGQTIVVFVHGCFWHGHTKCSKGAHPPKSNRGYWQTKIERNKRRDKRVAQMLRRRGFRVFTVWECSNLDRIPRRLLLAGKKGNRPVDK